MISRMRRGIVLALAMVMMLSVSLTAFASSPSKQGGGEGVLVETNVNDLDVVVTKSSKETKEVGDALESTGLADQGWRTRDVVGYWDVTAFINGKEVKDFENNGYARIRLNVPAVKKTSKIAVIHWKSDGTTEKLDYSIPEEGKVDVWMKTFSVIAVLVDNETGPAASGSGSGSGAAGGAGASGSGSVSPKTGEGNATEMAILIGMAALGGAMVLSRKKEYR